MEDELIPQELDPMPGEEFEQEPEGVPAVTEEEPQQAMTPEEEAELMESIIMKNPKLREPYLRGLQSDPQRQPQPQEEEPAGPPALDPMYFEGDPMGEQVMAMLQFQQQQIQQMKQERDQALQQAQVAQQDQATLAELSKRTGAAREDMVELAAIPGLSAAMAQIPQLGKFIEDSLKLRATGSASAAQARGSVSPPASLGDAGGQGQGNIKAKVAQFKRQGIFSDYTDKQIEEYIRDVEGG